MQLKYKSYTTLSHNLFIGQRMNIALLYVFFAFTDIITTYFGITNYHLVETVNWTGYILNHYGWYGVMLRTILGSITIMYVFKYMPNLVFKNIKYVSIGILVLYVMFTTANNILLMVT